MTVGHGTILEASFVDPAYSYPPAEGQGRNAIELQATSTLLRKVEPGADDRSLDTNSPSVASIDSAHLSLSRAPDKAEEDLRKKRVKVTYKTTEETYEHRGFGFMKCCRSSKQVEFVEQEYGMEEPTKQEIKHARNQAIANIENMQELQNERRESRELRRQENNIRRARRADNQRADNDRKKYSVAEGILIYRLNTANQTISLVSGISSNTDTRNLMREMVIAHAAPSHDSTRRGICLVGLDGSRATITACEQRTAIAWLEALDMMLGKKQHRKKANKSSSAWAFENKNDRQIKEIEESYLNLALYSNNLISDGDLPESSGEKKDGSGIYYSIESSHVDGAYLSDETLEALAKRRAVIKDSWDFYRMICSLLRDRRKYDEVFRRLQLDPVYPYLNSMIGLNDPGDDGYENVDKVIRQKSLPKYSAMTRTQICKEMVENANQALESLVEICKALAGSLGMEEVGVGPVKEASSAIRKAENKYGGDVLKVTDYCRALLVVKDLPTLLALLELARDSFGPLIRRVKLSTLKSDHNPIPGGYRDCKINLELKDHICEIQVHVWPMWVVCGVDGFRHYRHCLEYATDSFGDPYDALDGLDRKTMAELIVMSEEAVADMPLYSIEWYHEKFILDYFAEVGLFLRHNLAVWAEVTLRQLIKLRYESPDIGPEHHETRLLESYLEQAYRAQDKHVQADHLKEKLLLAEQEQELEKNKADRTLWDTMFTDPWEAMDIIMDPNKNEREQEERRKKEVKASKRQWIKIRKKKFEFLDIDKN